LFEPLIQGLGDLPVILDGLLEGFVGLLKLPANLFHFARVILGLGRTHGQAKGDTTPEET
jgi:hypothetical protein